MSDLLQVTTFMVYGVFCLLWGISIGKDCKVSEEILKLKSLEDILKIKSLKVKLKSGAVIRTNGIIDTGCNLTYSGKHVIVIDYNIMRGTVEGNLVDRMESLFKGDYSGIESDLREKGLVVIPYCTISNKSARMLGLEVDSVWVGGTEYKDVIVGLTDKINFNYQSIIPATLLI